MDTIQLLEQHKATIPHIKTLHMALEICHFWKRAIWLSCGSIWQPSEKWFISTTL